MTTSVPLARRQFLSQSTSLTLSAAAIGALAGVPRLARAEGDPAKDTAILNVALGLEHEAINAYQLGAKRPAAKARARRGGAVPVAPQGPSRRVDRHHPEMGGKPVAEKSLDDYAKALNAASLKNQADVLTLAAKLELGATNAYLGVIPAFKESKLGKVAARLAADETMHWTALAVRSAVAAGRRA